MIGETLGAYKILEKLGGGGMGDVYLASDPRLSRTVALKILPPEVASDAERLARFEREARTVAALNHPNIVTVYAIEEAAGVRFISMEYVHGRRLSEVIPPQGLPLKTLLELAVPLADAISAAHRHGTVHRDLKPDNVMVTDEGRVKVLDFGIAKLKLQSAEGGTTLLGAGDLNTADGRILGTVAYMSPEQVEGKAVDHRTDIFSLGIMLYEMATGGRPFQGDSYAATMVSILTHSPPSVTDLRPAMPPELGKIIKRCLAKDPAARYQDAQDLRNGLAELRQELESAEHLKTITVAGARGRRRERMWMLGAALAAVTGAAAITYVVLSDEPGGAPTSLSERTFTQLTHGPGQELFPSLSPDGKTLAYASDAAGNQDVYLLRVGGENPVNLTQDSPADDSQPAFAPDGERLAFRSERGAGGIFVMGATGESARRVADFGYHPAWSPDGTRILCVTQSVRDPRFRFTNSQLWIVTAGTGEKQLLTKDDAVQPQWSPGGHRIAYWGRHPKTGSADIWTIPAAGGDAVPAITDPSTDWNPVWSADGEYLYFASDRGGSMNIWRVPIDERSGALQGAPEAVTAEMGSAVQHISRSQDGRRLAYVVQAETMNVRQISFDAAKERTTSEPRWVTRGSRLFTSPEPSPDARSLAFASAGKQEDIFVVANDGGSLRQLTDDAFRDRTPRWSPNGDRIAFYSDRTGGYEIWVVKPDGSGLQQLTRSPGAHYPVWSPDGTRMAYSTHSPNGAFIFDLQKPWKAQQRQPVPTLSDQTQSFELWSWSPDGTRLAGQRHLADLSHAGIGVYTVGSQTIEWLTDFGEWPVWLTDGRRLLFSHQGKLFLIDRQTRKSHEILATEQQSIGSAGLSRDNRTIHFTVRAAEADVWLLTFK